MDDFTRNYENYQTNYIKTGYKMCRFVLHSFQVRAVFKFFVFFGALISVVQLLDTPTKFIETARGLKCDFKIFFPSSYIFYIFFLHFPISSFNVFSRVILKLCCFSFFFLLSDARFKIEEGRRSGRGRSDTKRETKYVTYNSNFF